MEGRTVVQQYMRYVQEYNYICWHRVDPGTNQVVDLMFAHPQSIQSLRTFHHVLLMDSSYKTNRYKISLLEIIGVTPVGKNFNVAFVYMGCESEEHYRWALGNLRSLFDGISFPDVIVIDRELGLLKAVEETFPESYHLLCLFHINKNVQLNATKFMSGRKGVGTHFFRTIWKPLVESLSEEEYNKRYADMVSDYRQHKQLMAYLNETWLVYKEKFVRAWTNRVFHLGNTTTNRVESLHSALKDRIGSSTGGFDTLWTEIHAHVECQFQTIMTEMSRSSRVKKDVKFTIFRHLSGRVSHLALEKLEQEHVAGMRDGIWSNPSKCTCYLLTTHGLPCAHLIAEKECSGDIFYSRDIYPFWRTLSMEAHAESIPETNSTVEYKQLLYGYVDRIIDTRPDYPRKRAIEIPFSKLYPEASQVGEPSAHQTNRPRKMSTKREVSAWECTFSKLAIVRSSSGSGSKGRDRSSSGSGSRGRARSSQGSMSRGRGKSESSNASANKFDKRTEFVQFLPHFVVPNIVSWVDMIGDGNSGYRCVAKVVKGSQHHWMEVREELYLELQQNLPFYAELFGGGQQGRVYVAHMMISLCHWTSEPAPRDRWMILSDMGLVIATVYNAMVVELSLNQNITHLPLYEAEATKELSFVIPIGYKASEEHFMLLELRDGFPLPPYNPKWARYRQDSVQYLDNRFWDRLDIWQLLANTS